MIELIGIVEIEPDIGIGKKRKKEDRKKRNPKEILAPPDKSHVMEN
jgi:hypothetical protein